MKSLALFALSQIFIAQVIAPPVNKAHTKEEDNPDPFEWTQNIEYKHYLMEVLSELEKDKEFQKRVADVKESNSTESIADQLQFVSHNVRTRLDEIKRKEILRLNELVAKKEKLEKGKGGKDHLDHVNPHTFEIQDLRRLINKVSSDLVQTDNQQEEEFKRYEMEKELKQRQKLKSIKDKKAREELQQKMEESKKRHRQHKKLHHPGSEEQLKEVWEKEDHLDPESFNPKTFFRMHDKDDNGHLDAAEIEALMMGELEKVYDENNPDDDVVERYHEMMKMRQEIMREVDRNNDTMVSYDEFMDWTKKKNYKDDTEWKTTEEQEKPVFTDEELQKFTETYKSQHPNEILEDLSDLEDGKGNAKHMQMKVEQREPVVAEEKREHLDSKRDKL